MNVIRGTPTKNKTSDDADVSGSDTVSDAGITDFSSGDSDTSRASRSTTPEPRSRKGKSGDTLKPPRGRRKGSKNKRKSRARDSNEDIVPEPTPDRPTIPDPKTGTPDPTIEDLGPEGLEETQERRHG